MSDAQPSAAENEARGTETLELEYGGESYTVPADVDEWPLSIVKAFEDGKKVTAIEELLGDQFPAFLAKSKRKDLEGFFDALAVRYGFKDAGESSAS